MPVLDGQQFVTRLRADSKLAGTPVIFYTATYREPEALRIGQSCGVHRVLRKPSDPTVILEAVNAELGARAGSAIVDTPTGYPLADDGPLSAMLEPAWYAAEPHADGTTRLASLLRLSVALAGRRDADGLLQAFCEAARSLVAAPYAGIGILDERQPERLRHYRAAGVDSEIQAAIAASPAPGGVLGHATAARRPSRLVDALPSQTGLPPVHPAGGSFLAVPMVSAFNSYGWAYWARQPGEPAFCAEEEQVAMAATSQFALAYENAVLLEDVQTHAAQLRQEVAERERAEQALQAAAQRKDEFLATLAHELRNPLAPLRNSLEVMRLAADDRARVEKARGMAERQVEHMVRLIDDLLDLSRITTGKLKLRKERVELGEIVRSAAEAAKGWLAVPDHQLTVSVPVRPVYLEADGARLTQVYSNLLNNAVKYTERGGRIRIGLEVQGNEAQVTVADSGIGIPEDKLEAIFEMFSQIHGAYSQDGLGIGLHLSRRLIEMHGGSITAHSAGHRLGSEFIVRLPLAETVQPQGDAPSGPAASAQAQRVLVVDDNADAAHSLACLLELMGHEVRVAHDGLEGLIAAEDFGPGLIFMDLRMPTMDGYQSVREIRRQDWGKAIRIIALSGWSQDEDRRKTRDAGFDDHLAKPVDPAELERVLAQAPAPRISVPSA